MARCKCGECEVQGIGNLCRHCTRIAELEAELAEANAKHQEQVRANENLTDSYVKKFKELEAELAQARETYRRHISDRRTIHEEDLRIKDAQLAHKDRMIEALANAVFDHGGSKIYEPRYMAVKKIIEAAEAKAKDDRREAGGGTGGPETQETRTDG